jgi:hypothetical protein
VVWYDAGGGVVVVSIVAVGSDVGGWGVCSISGWNEVVFCGVGVGWRLLQSS